MISAFMLIFPLRFRAVYFMILHRSLLSSSDFIAPAFTRAGLFRGGFPQWTLGAMVSRFGLHDSAPVTATPELRCFRVAVLCLASGRQSVHVGARIDPR